MENFINNNHTLLIILLILVLTIFNFYMTRKRIKRALDNNSGGPDNDKPEGDKSRGGFTAERMNRLQNRQGKNIWQRMDIKRALLWFTVGVMIFVIKAGPLLWVAESGIQTTALLKDVVKTKNLYGETRYVASYEFNVNNAVYHGQSRVSLKNYKLLKAGNRQKEEQEVREAGDKRYDVEEKIKERFHNARAYVTVKYKKNNPDRNILHNPPSTWEDLIFYSEIWLVITLLILFLPIVVPKITGRR